MARERVTGTSIKTVLEGYDGFQYAISKMVKNTSDLRYAWREFYEPGIREGNENYWRLDGDGKWPDLTDRYMFAKMRRGYGTRLLYGPGNADMSRRPGSRGGRRQYHRTPGTLMRSFIAENAAMRTAKYDPRRLDIIYRDNLANIYFTQKGRRARKPMNVRSLSFRMAFNEAIMHHLNWYLQRWDWQGRRIA
jgi:hypothetical protein